MKALKMAISVAIVGGTAVLVMLATGVFGRPPGGEAQQAQRERKQGQHKHAEHEHGQHHHGDKVKLTGPLPRPVVNTHELMELFNRPLYEFLKQEMQREAGTEKWDTIADRGYQAAEVANLVSIRTREQPEKWDKLAMELQKAGLNLAKAAQSENRTNVQQAYRNLIQNCNNCHNTMAPEHAPQLEP